MKKKLITPFLRSLFSACIFVFLTSFQSVKAQVSIDKTEYIWGRVLGIGNFYLPKAWIDNKSIDNPYPRANSAGYFRCVRSDSGDDTLTVMCYGYLQKTIVVSKDTDYCEVTLEADTLVLDKKLCLFIENNPDLIPLIMEAKETIDLWASNLTQLQNYRSRTDLSHIDMMVYKELKKQCSNYNNYFAKHCYPELLMYDLVSPENDVLNIWESIVRKYCNGFKGTKKDALKIYSGFETKFCEE